jgi:hypothetical protein
VASFPHEAAELTPRSMRHGVCHLRVGGGHGLAGIVMPLLFGAEYDAAITACAC